MEDLFNFVKFKKPQGKVQEGINELVEAIFYSGKIVNQQLYETPEGIKKAVTVLLPYKVELIPHKGYDVSKLDNLKSLIAFSDHNIYFKLDGSSIYATAYLNYISDKEEVEKMTDFEKVLNKKKQW